MDIKDKKIFELEKQLVEAKKHSEALVAQFSKVADAQREVGEELKAYILELEAEMDRKDAIISEANKAAEQERLELQKQYEAHARELQLQFQTIANELSKESSQHQETKSQLKSIELQLSRVHQEKSSLQASEKSIKGKLDLEIQAHVRTKSSLQEMTALWESQEQKTRSATSKERENLMVMDTQLKELRNSYQAEKAKQEALTKELEASKAEFARMKARLDEETEKNLELSKFKEEILAKRETNRITLQAKRPTTSLEPPNLPLPKAPGNRNTLAPLGGVDSLPRNSFLDPNKRKTISEKRKTLQEQNNNIIVRIEEITNEMGEIEKELTEADQRTIVLETALTFTENQRKEGEKYFKQLSTAMNALLKKIDTIMQAFTTFSSGSSTLDSFRLLFNREAQGLKSVLQVVQEDVAKQLVKVSELPSSPPVPAPPKSLLPPTPGLPKFSQKEKEPPQSGKSVFEVLNQIRSGSFSLKKVTEVDKTKMRRDIRRSKAVLMDLQETLKEALKNHRLGMFEDTEVIQDIDDADW